MMEPEAGVKAVDAVIKSFVKETDTMSLPSKCRGSHMSTCVARTRSNLTVNVVMEPFQGVCVVNDFIWIPDSWIVVV